jgi:hypothetical protein
MKTFCIIEKLSGNILYTAMLATGVPELQAETICIELPDALKNKAIIELYFKNNVLKERPLPTETQKWNNDLEIWEDDLEKVRSIKSELFKTKCYEVINGGFSAAIKSSVLFYPTTPIDQINLSTAISLKINTFILCKNELDIWDFIEHTSEEIESLNLLYANHILTARLKNLNLQKELSTGITLEDLNKIVW